MSIQQSKPNVSVNKKWAWIWSFNLCFFFIKAHLKWLHSIFDIDFARHNINFHNLKPTNPYLPRSDGKDKRHSIFQKKTFSHHRVQQCTKHSIKMSFTLFIWRQKKNQFANEIIYDECVARACAICISPNRFSIEFSQPIFRNRYNNNFFYSFTVCSVHVPLCSTYNIYQWQNQLKL